EEQYQEAQEMVERLARAKVDKDTLSEFQFVLAQCYYNRAALREEAEPASSRRLFRQALELLDALAEGRPGAPDLRGLVADVHYRLGPLAWVKKRKAEAAGHFRQARDHFAALAAEVRDGGPGPGGPGFNENAFAWFLANCPDESLRDP